MINHKLFNKLLKDEKKVDATLYTSGPMWRYQNFKISYQIRKKGLNNFRGIESGVGSGYCDNVMYDIRNELNFNGRLAAKLFDLPFIKKLFSKQLRINRDNIKNYLGVMAQLYKKSERVSELIEKYKFEKTTEFNCVKKFTSNNKEYSCQYLDEADKIDHISKKLDLNSINSFFEIGGGFGSNIHFLLTNFKNIKKIIYLDIAANLYVGTEYLRFLYGSAVKDYLYTSNLKEITFENNDKLEIICIPTWQIKKINFKIDHFHNAKSFVEIPKRIVEHYVDCLKKINLKDVSLVTYCNSTMEFNNPEDLNLIFDNALDTEWHEMISHCYEKTSNLYLTGKLVY